MYSREEIEIALTRTKLKQDPAFAKFLNSLATINPHIIYRKETSDSIRDLILGTKESTIFVVSGLICLYNELAQARNVGNGINVVNAYKVVYNSPLLNGMIPAYFDIEPDDADSDYTKPNINLNTKFPNGEDKLYELIVLLNIYGERGQNGSHR